LSPSFDDGVLQARPPEDGSDYDAAVPFTDVLQANETYAAGFEGGELTGKAARELAVLTCIDTRIDPLAMLGLRPGDAKILRNAGARVTDDVLRTLVLARYLLNVKRVMVVAHTDCRMVGGTDADVHEAIRSQGGPDTRSLVFAVTNDVEQTLRSDVQRARSFPYLEGLEVGGFVYDVRTGRVSTVC
jgi:carbonic anhydrase